METVSESELPWELVLGSELESALAKTYQPPRFPLPVVVLGWFRHRQILVMSGLYLCSAPWYRLKELL